MKLPALSRQQVRHVDQVAVDRYRMPSIVLMENAGRGAAEIIGRTAPDGLIVILCGGGNNGGDGYVVARHLELAGRDVRVVSLKALDELQGDAKINADIARASDIDIRVVTDPQPLADAIRGAGTLVDALLGTGATGAPRGIYADAVTLANSAEGVQRVALDIPTGLDCDSGTAGDPTFRADHTLTFVARKLGFDQPSAQAFLGRVDEVAIGVPARLLRSLRDSPS